MASKARVTNPGVISVGDVYTLQEACARLGWSESALRSAKRRGLSPLSCGKRKYLSGQEIVRFLEATQNGRLAS
jgi:hypothetical protein